MDSRILLDNIILKVEVGSTAHGTGIPDQEDRDEMAIAIEPLECIYGLETVKTLTYRPGRSPTDPSGPGDLDLVVYPLKKWVSLALAANPSILMLFWSTPIETSIWGDELQKNYYRFISRKIFETHIGYATQQISRMKQGKHGESRQYLIDQYGYDTKYAMHALRLLLQGYELSQTGRITLPIPNPEGDLLRDVRRGKYTQNDFYELFDFHLMELLEESKLSTLPSDPDKGWVTRFITDIYMSMSHNSKYLYGYIT